MSQVILNLLTNAIEAIENNGQITLTTQNLMVDAALIHQPSELKPGPYICLAMQDTGGGMDAETLTRIFEPFYTTKFQGRGLGLAAAYGIVNNHGGHITVTSQVGQGATFTVCLPAISAERPQL